jgi:hypothetical protein
MQLEGRKVLIDASLNNGMCTICLCSMFHDFFLILS